VVQDHLAAQLRTANSLTQGRKEKRKDARNCKSRKSRKGQPPHLWRVSRQRKMAVALAVPAVACPGVLALLLAPLRRVVAFVL